MEAVPQTAAMLKDAAAELGYSVAESTAEGHLRVIHAIGDADAGAWRRFPGGLPGIETLGVGDKPRDAMRYGSQLVRTTTVDELVQNYSLGTVDVLSIDTEGK